MAWYKTGTVSVTAGSNAVIGSGTSFIANARVGDGFRGPDGKWYEINNIASDTALSIAPNYLGPTLSSGIYAVMPVQGYNKDSADQLRAATKVIGAGATDMTAQVALAQTAAASASASKDAVTTLEASATQSKNAAASSATTASSAKDQAVQSASEALASKNASKTSETNAGNSATRAEAAAASAANKASAGANSDITSLSGLTTALSVAQGGTGGKTTAAAKVALGIEQQIAGQPSGTDCNTLVSLRTDYYIVSGINTPTGSNGYLSVIPLSGGGECWQRFVIVNGTGTYERTRLSNAWGAWKKVLFTADAPSTTWGGITGALSNQADLQAALTARVLSTDKRNCTAWVTFSVASGVVSILDSYNISSISRVRAGEFVVNFAVSMANVNYCAAGSAAGNAGSGPLIAGRWPTQNSTKSVSQFAICTLGFSGSLIDSTEVTINVFGGL